MANVYDNMFRPRHILIKDPITNLNVQKDFAILKGGVEVTERTFTSTNFSESSTTFSVPPPNPTTFVSRRFMLKQKVRITISRTAGNGNAYEPGFDGFKQYPLASAMQTLDVTLNGQSISLNMADIIKPLLLYHNNERDVGDREMSTSPWMRDQTQNYDDLVEGTTTFPRNPLNQFLDSYSRSQIPRGGFSYDQINIPDSNNAVIDATLTEELLISPLLFGGVRDEGFIGLQKIEINITWVNDLSRMWCHIPFDADGSEAGYAVNVTFPFPPSMLFRYITPPMTFQIQPFYQYSYNEIQRYQTTVGTVQSYGIGANSNVTSQSINGLTSITQVSDTIQLNSIPRFLYIFIKEKISSFSQADSFLSIVKCRINWNNNNALLSNASQQQLYDISRKNGVDCSWSEWTAQPQLVANSTVDGGKWVAGIGSVLCLEFGTDIGLRETEAPGMIGTYNLQIEVDYKNLSGITRGQTGNQLMLNLITITNGLFTIYQNSASKRIGLLDRQDVLNARELIGYNYYNLQKNLMNGGFNIKKFARRAARLVKRAAPLVKAFVPEEYHKYINLGNVVAQEGLRQRKVGKKKRKKAKKKAKRLGRIPASESVTRNVEYIPPAAPRPRPALRYPTTRGFNYRREGQLEPGCPTAGGQLVRLEDVLGVMGSSMVGGKPRKKKRKVPAKRKNKPLPKRRKQRAIYKRKKKSKR